MHAVRQELPIDNAMFRRNYLSIDAQAAGKDCFFVVRAGIVPAKNEKGFGVVI